MQICIEIPPEKEATIIEVLLQKESLAEEQSETPESITSITQEVVVAQEKEKENEVALETVLSDLGLRLDLNAHGSTNKTISYAGILTWFNRLGANLFESVLYTILTAWPTDEKKWHAKIIDEICTFVYIYRDYKIDFKRLTNHLMKKFTNRSDLETASDFENTITNIPGEATLEKYDSKMKNENRLPKRKLYDNFNDGGNRE